MIDLEIICKICGELIYDSEILVCEQCGTDHNDSDVMKLPEKRQKTYMHNEVIDET